MTWEQGDAGDVTCPKCGAVYHVTFKNFPARDRGSFDCEQCGEHLKSWSGTTDYFFTKAKDGQKGK